MALTSSVLSILDLEHNTVTIDFEHQAQIIQDPY